MNLEYVFLHVATHMVNCPCIKPSQLKNMKHNHNVMCSIFVSGAILLWWSDYAEKNTATRTVCHWRKKPFNNYIMTGAWYKDKFHDLISIHKQFDSIRIDVNSFGRTVFFFQGKIHLSQLMRLKHWLSDYMMHDTFCKLFLSTYLQMFILC